MPSNKNNKDYHASAASAYGDNAQKNTANPREVEARVLLKAARALQEIQENWDSTEKAVLEETLIYNRQVWMIFYDEAIQNSEGSRPNDLRSNIVNLANFIFKRELDVLADPSPKKLDILISINRDIAAGLLNMPDASTNKIGDDLENNGDSDSDD